MRLLVCVGVLISTVAFAAAATALEVPARIANEVNVTTDSAQGWLPTIDQRQGAITTVDVFLEAIEARRYADAYGLLSDFNRRNRSLAKFTQEAREFSALAAPLKFWRVVKVTWTRTEDPARAPQPGTYVAVDLIGQFANIDRNCGYIVLYQQPTDGSFVIVRRENNFLDNATVRSIEEKHSKAEVARTWIQLSRHCPNYRDTP